MLNDRFVRGPVLVRVMNPPSPQLLKLRMLFLHQATLFIVDIQHIKLM